MQRWTAIVFVGLVTIAIAVVVLRAGPNRTSTGAATTSTSSSSMASATGGRIPHATPPIDAPVAADSPNRAAVRVPDDLDAGIDLDSLGLLDSSGEDAGGGRTLPDGNPAPKLPASAPQAVTFGAVLIEYQGAQGAGASTRSRDQAVVLAKQLAALAKTDFKAAVQQGDKGSSDDLGGMQRNILEPGPEFVLFSLAPNEVSEPVDSPRGFYVFKRID